MLVYGRNVAKEMLKKPKKVKKILLQQNFSDKELNSMIENSKLPVRYLNKNEISRFAKFSHQGIILEIEDFHYASLEEITKEECQFVVILDHIEDPHNFGAIIRTAEAAGVDGIIIPKDRSVEVNATVMKTSAGTCELLPIVQVTNLNQTIEKLKKEGFWVVGTALEDSVDYREIDYSSKIALVVGNEGHGISNGVRKSCDFIAKIPMYGKTNSLNVSVASGILIYEVVRNQRK